MNSNRTSQKSFELIRAIFTKLNRLLLKLYSSALAPLEAPAPTNGLLFGGSFCVGEVAELLKFIVLEKCDDRDYIKFFKLKQCR